MPLCHYATPLCHLTPLCSFKFSNKRFELILLPLQPPRFDDYDEEGN